MAETLTYDTLIAMANDGDPLIDAERPGSASVTPEGLLILGCDERGCDDLLIRIEPDGRLRAWLRDPEDRKDTFHGREWTVEATFDAYDDLVTWVYSW